ncbi:MAG: hypothetical protein K2Q03_06260, partial [Sphingobacteriaceae bacterium]|nr:hypothetical protein [Sphingobacteriaceae bacterium]
NFALTFNSFSFIPQIRYTRKLTKEFSVMGMTFMNSLQSFSTVGGNGTGPDLTQQLNGVAMAQFAKVPSFALQANYDNGKIWATIGGEISVLRPRTIDTFNELTGNATGLATDVTKKYNENLMTSNLIATAKISLTKNTMLKLNSTYGQNFSQYVGLGGMAEYRDRNNGKYKYSAVNVWNSWAEISYAKNKTFQPTLFLGYIKNLGLTKNLSDADVNSSTIAFSGRAMSKTRTFDDILRIAPRLDIISGKMKIQFEYEFTKMLYGDTDPTFQITKTTEARKFSAENHRLSTVLIYSF